MAVFRITRATQPLRGTVHVPADKSISHRAAILSALAEGETRIENWLNSATTRSTLNVIKSLGVDVEQSSPATVIIRGRGLRSLREPDGALYCAGSGTTMRLHAGVCAGQPFLSIFEGSPALMRRPMARIVQPLRAMGATVLGRAGGQFPPLAIQGARLRGIDYTLAVASAQVKSAILLAALFAESPTNLREPAVTRDHTERMLGAFGVQMRLGGSQLGIDPVERLSTPSLIHIPNDISSAAFLIGAAILVPGSSIEIKNVCINPTRTGLLDALEQMGAHVTIENKREESGEPVAELHVAAAENLRAIEVAGSIIPRMIDEFPIFAVLATQACGEIRVRDAAELRVKESDRIAALAFELRTMGAQIEEQADGFTIAGPTRLIGARVSAHDDHRLAMALAVAGLVADGETIIEGWECVADSFPGFAGKLLALVTGERHEMGEQSQL